LIAFGQLAALSSWLYAYMGLLMLAISKALESLSTQVSIPLGTQTAKQNLEVSGSLELLTNLRLQFRTALSFRPGKQLRGNS
jgi:hypothetical protein